MNILVLGAGGREHALCWKLAQSPQVKRLFALPGSDGIAQVATCIPGDPCDAATVGAAVAAYAIDLTVVGPEAPLAAGVTDAIRAAGHLVFGPSQAAAQLETSKIFAKQFLVRRNIPTARFEAVDNLAAGRRALTQFGLPIVLKADGLAAGKGVVVTADQTGAEWALEHMLSGELVGAAGRRVVIEECLQGPELSLLAVCDGEHWRLLPPSRDHKRLHDGDRGPNTGGMGALADESLMSTALREAVEARIIAPTLRGMAAASMPFQGVLYCGLMVTVDGPKVLEFNVRFGDPETQAVLPLWPGDLAALLRDAAQGNLTPATETPVPASAVAVVAAAAGYPAAPERGDEITGLVQAAAGALVFHAGTRRHDDRWETNGGRVLAVTAVAPDASGARAAAYRVLDFIHFRGMQFRRDIANSLTT